MRVEWAKTKARADRWQEEILLTVEEMRRTIHYLDWQSKWWFDHADLHVNASPALRQGTVAYSAKQATLLKKLALSFAEKWHPELVRRNLPRDWPSELIPVNPLSA
jgi:hypothetical protein